MIFCYFLIFLSPLFTRTDEIQHRLPLDGLELSGQIWIPDLHDLMQLMLSVWEPYNLHALYSTCFLGWVCTLTDRAQQPLTTAGEELDYLDHDQSDLSEELDYLDHYLSDLSEELDDLDHDLSDL